jgi:hypothetical protein
MRGSSNFWAEFKIKLWSFLKKGVFAKLVWQLMKINLMLKTGNSKEGSITVLLTSCLTGLKSSV